MKKITIQEERTAKEYDFFHKTESGDICVGLKNEEGAEMLIAWNGKNTKYVDVEAYDDESLEEIIDTVRMSSGLKSESDIIAAGTALFNYIN